jgi:AhpD family alkylhydroperoxidase
MNFRANYRQLSSNPLNKLIALDASLADTAVEQKLRDLVILRASQINGCLFCVDKHVKEAKLHGESELRLHHLGFWRESNLFNEREKAALEWTELMTRLPTETVGEKEYFKAMETLNEKEISDLTFVIGTINLWNRIGVAFRPEPGSLDKAYGLDKVYGLEKAGQG